METSRNKTSTPGLQRMALGELFQTEPASCSEHGPYMAMRTPVGLMGCPVCNAARIKAQDEAMIRAVHAEQRSQRIARAFGGAAIPPRFANRRLNTFDAYTDRMRSVLAAVQSYFDNFDAAMRTGASIILCGAVGAGKTHLAVSVANAVIERGYSAVFITVNNAIGTVKETYRRDSALTEAAAVTRLVAPDLLVLDDVGVQHGTEAEKLILFNILNGRYEQMKPTILTGNFPLQSTDGHSITSFLGERVVDRLREGGGRVLVCDWESYRGKAT